MTDPHKLLQYFPFTRLARLLEGVPPGQPPRIPGDGRAPGAPIQLSVGEPQGQAPAFVAEELARAAAGWSRYPPPRGTPDYLEACAGWLARRYGVPEGMIDPARMIVAVPGTREGLFFAALVAEPPAGARNGRPAVLLPNPFYHVYAGAAEAAGAEPVFVPATRASGFLPDYAALPEAVLARTVLAYYCTPSNPQGAAADLDRLQGLIQLARRFGFTVAFDECYGEIYTGTPPPGALQAAAALGGSLDHVLVFQSLSKRSSAPGLRCGFAVGDPARIAPLAEALRVGGAGVPLPVLAAGARLWGEDDHVAANRAGYQRNFAIAERVLGNRFGFRTPAGGFFLWLEVGDGEAAARALWRAAGIRVLPGAYMSVAGPDGANPGAPYVRVALVYEAATTEAALERMVEVLA